MAIYKMTSSEIRYDACIVSNLHSNTYLTWVGDKIANSIKICHRKPLCPNIWKLKYSKIYELNIDIRNENVAHVRMPFN